MLGMRKGFRFGVPALLLACSPEYEVLRGPSSPGTAASGGLGSGGASGAASSAGVAGSGGAGRDADSGGAESLPVGGEPGEGGTGTSGGTGGGGLIHCASHLDCDAGTVCHASQCVPCADPPGACSGPCDHGFRPVLAAHNGCTVCECAPTSECTDSADCTAGEHCYPGSQCEPGCSDPSCCAGNRCSAVGCAGSPVPHCLAAGCAGGAVCLAACDAVACECDGAQWRCAESPGAAGAPSEACPQACVSP